MRVTHLLSGIVCCGCVVLLACGGGDDESAPGTAAAGGAGAGGGKAGAAGKASGGAAGAGGNKAGSAGAAGKAGAAGASGAAGAGGGKAGAGGGGAGGAAAGKAGSGGSSAGNGGASGASAGKGGAGAGGASAGSGGAGKGGASAGASGAGAGGATAGNGGAGAGGTTAGNGGAGAGGTTAGNGGAGGATAGAGGAGAGGAAAGNGGAGAGGAAAGNGGAGAAGSACAGLANGAPCDDGDACTTGDSCNGGACVPGAPKTCAAQDQCHDAGTCDPSTGQCSTPSKPDGTTCSDSDACTQADTCQGGACVGASPVVCPVAAKCKTQGVCNPQTGVCSASVNAPNLSPCDDGDPCSVNDYCIAGSCFAGAAKSCPWTDPCHSGACNPSSGACEPVAVPNGDPCVDGDACSTGDTCTAGVCDGATKCGAPGSVTVVISELRSRHNGSGTDEFVELYNTTGSAIDISGWKLKFSSNSPALTTRATVPASTSIPAYGHYLFANTGYSGAVQPDQARYSTGLADNGGVAITTAADVVVDSVGFSAGAAHEGTNLAQLSGGTTSCYERLPGSGHGSPIDTNNNSVDFFLSATCDPQNRASEPAPAFSHAPAALFFAGQGATPVQATTTLTNTLAGPLTLQSATLSGANAAEFSFVFASALPQTLAAAGTLAVTVTHTPAASGRRFATLLVTTGDGETRSVELMAGDVP